MDIPREKRSLDPLGHGLFSERVQLGLDLLGEALEIAKINHTPKTKPSHWVITGVGSSEGHGRFLSYLINSYTNHTAEFWALSAFISKPQNKKASGLIVFSQGLSSNAQLALNKRDAFNQCVLFSAVSPATGIAKKKALLLNLRKDGVEHIQCTPDNEYTLLIRVAGPLTGYIHCIDWVRGALDGKIPEPSNALLETLASARKHGQELPSKELLAQIKEGLLILTQGASSQFSQNLAYKLTEGLFIPMPQLCDMLSFSHGPFQALCKKPSHILTLSGKHPQEEQLTRKAAPLIERCASGASTYQSQLSDPWRIFEHEMLFNGLLEALFPLTGVDQVNWPGKGEDASLYDLSDLG